ncbi:MAG: hypothetical protein GF346_07535 [Candidatus Eisenbacteria bacterium]|nr:hypothetical protein [Candidatus Latescibacterota bacterium]MBD3302284.1 hypothetical protein [Candidatus Eisenbacteria bacterium]
MTTRTAWALLALTIAAASLATPAGASPYWSPEDVASRYGGAPPVREPGSFPEGALRQPSSDLEMYGWIAAFLSTWQVDDPEDPQYGGMREGESLPDIIQTDNTSESIWVWTRYEQLTGDDRYRPNIDAAWTYCMNYPAYLEEGGGAEIYGYYRMYNCGWALRAENLYRDVYGDASFQAYADSCAGYIRDHTLSQDGPPFYDQVNTHVLAWALGNLYDAGLHDGEQGWIDHAVEEAGTKVKAWIEADPTLLGNETWAMAGGASAWGLLRSYFAAHPDEAEAWFATYKDQIDTFSSPGQFQNAWNGWYALGHRAVGLALEDPEHLGLHVSLTAYLVSEDEDDDGGIPARPEDTDDDDQTWVTNYLAFMGLSDKLGPTSDVAESRVDADVPALRMRGPNPFRRATALWFELARPGPVAVTIHDLSGRRVARPYEGIASAGPVEIAWNGRTDAGRRAPAGTYFVTVRTEDRLLGRRIVRLR